MKLDDGKTIDVVPPELPLRLPERWGVSYVMAYELTARGGQWGLSEERSVQVTLTDIAFGYAGDARQELSSKPSPYATLTAKLP